MQVFSSAYISYPAQVIVTYVISYQRFEERIIVNLFIHSFETPQEIKSYDSFIHEAIKYK